MKTSFYNCRILLKAILLHNRIYRKTCLKKHEMFCMLENIRVKCELKLWTKKKKQQPCLAWKKISHQELEPKRHPESKETSRYFR